MCRRVSCDHCAHCKTMGEKRHGHLESDGLELTAWYGGRTDMLTLFSDPQIGAKLGWIPGLREARDPSREAFVNGRGDGNRVRAARRHVDRCTCFFDGYTFGTKTNGAGRHLSRLHIRGTDPGGDPLRMQVGENIARIQQGSDQRGAELERNIAELNDAKDTFERLGDIPALLCVHDALRDVETYGRLQPATVTRARQLGIPIPRGLI